MIVTEKLGYLNKWRLFGAPLFNFPPNPWSGSATGCNSGLYCIWRIFWHLKLSPI